MCKENEEYFNQSYATKGWVSIKRTEETKHIIAEKTSAFWKTEEGKLKKARLVERNKQTKSLEMKKRWSENRDYMMNTHHRGRTKGSKNKIPGAGSRRNDIKQVLYDGVVYKSAKEASVILSKSASYIRKKCRKKEKGWMYI